MDIQNKLQLALVTRYYPLNDTVRGGPSNTVPLTESPPGVDMKIALLKWFDVPLQ